jgi:hypothetical protein
MWVKLDFLTYLFLYLLKSRKYGRDVVKQEFGLGVNISPTGVSLTFLQFENIFIGNYDHASASELNTFERYWQRAIGKKIEAPILI